ncbi:MAG: serine hydrolase domain-containing protein, partial [Phormidesmis sp.]
YGDAGMALAGYLVETVSKIPFEKYIDQNIFQTLNMRHSSFSQPLPANLSADLAVGYTPENGRYSPTPFLCGHSVPTIGLSTTATDMAHFMIAQLESGRYANKQILDSATVQEMQRQQFTHFPQHIKAAGSAYGFYERLQNHQRALEHGGNLYGYTSQVFLLPEHHMGFFVAFNTEDNSEIRERLIKQFLDRYYPQQKQPGASPKADLSEAARKRSQQISGTYRFIRYPHRSIAKFWIICFGSRPDLHLEANSNGTFTLLPRGTKWVETEPWLLRYQDVDDVLDSNNYLTIQQDHQGNPVEMALSNYIYVAYEKLKWYESVDLHRTVLGFCCLVFLVDCGFFVRVFINRRRYRRFLKQPKLARLSQLIAAVAAALNLLFVIGIFWVIGSINQWEFFTGMPPVVIALLWLPIGTTVLTVGLLTISLLVLRDKQRSVLSRLLYILTSLTSGIFLLLLNYWNLLGFHF